MIIAGFIMSSRMVDELRDIAKRFAFYYRNNPALTHKVNLGREMAALEHLAIALAVHGGYPEIQQNIMWHLWIEFGDYFRRWNSRDHIINLLKSAQFGVPKGVPDTVTLWRGGRTDPARLATGYSWSRFRSGAIEYALHPGVMKDHSASKPFLISAEFPASQLIFFNDDGIWETLKSVNLHQDTAFQQDECIAIRNFVQHLDPYGITPIPASYRPARVSRRHPVTSQCSRKTKSTG